jgi:hypothetical protein
VREILYSRSPKFLSFNIHDPRKWNFDTAIGIDPIIKSLWTGKVYFELSIAGKMRPEIHLEEEIELSTAPAKEFAWQKVRIDLAKYSGENHS